MILTEEKGQLAEERIREIIREEIQRASQEKFSIHLDLVFGDGDIPLAYREGYIAPDERVIFKQAGGQACSGKSQ